MKQLAYDVIDRHPTIPPSERALAYFSAFVRAGGPTVFLSNPKLANDSATRRQRRLAMSDFEKGGSFDSLVEPTSEEQAETQRKHDRMRDERDSTLHKRLTGKDPSETAGDDEPMSFWQKLRKLCLALGPDVTMSVCAALCSEEDGEGEDSTEGAEPKDIESKRINPHDASPVGFGPRETLPLSLARAEESARQADADVEKRVADARRKATKDKWQWPVGGKTRAMDARSADSLWDSMFPNSARIQNFNPVTPKADRVKAQDNREGGIPTLEDMFGPNANRIKWL